MKQYSTALSIAKTNCEADIVYRIISEMRNEGISIKKIIEYCSKVEGCINYLPSYRVHFTCNSLNAILEILILTKFQTQFIPKDNTK